MNYPYLNNLDFLAQLAEERVKEHYIKITVLDWEEKEIAEVQSSINSGSININGDSSLRRSGSLTTNLDPAIYDVDDINNLFSLNKKIKIEKGLNNPSLTLYQDYPVIWFPLGIYVITGLSISYQANGSIQLSITIQDKMCLLNGTVGGVIPAAMNADKMTTIDEDTGAVIEKKVIIKDIIKEMVNHWGGEQLGNILISGVPEKILSVRQWNNPIPLLIKKDSSEYEVFPEENWNQLPNMVIDSQKDAMQELINEDAKAESGGETRPITYSVPEGGWQLKDEYASIYLVYNIGEICGREWVPFCYTANEKGLVINAGATITSVLDTLVNYLGNAEYFYDVYGKFVFREKPNNLNQTEAKYATALRSKDITYDDVASAQAAATKFVFNDTILISAITKAPNILNVKNNFVVIGQKTVGKNKLPIYYETAIDNLPEIKPNVTYTICYYYDKSDKLVKAVKPINSSYTELENKLNPAEDIFYYCYDTSDASPASKRFDYPVQVGLYQYSSVSDKYVPLLDGEQGQISQLTNVNTSDMKEWQTYMYYYGVSQAGEGLELPYYFMRLRNEWPKVFDLKNNKFYHETDDRYNDDYFLEIIDAKTTEVGKKFGIPSISRRTYVYNNTKINCLYEPEQKEDDILYVINTDDVETVKAQVTKQNSNYHFITVTQNWLSTNTQQKAYWLSAYSVMRDLLYQYTHYNETVQLTTIPLYFLEANCQIELGLTNEKLSGKYWVKSVSVPLDSNGTMNISTTKLLKKF